MADAAKLVLSLFHISKRCAGDAQRLAACSRTCMHTKHVRLSAQGHFDTGERDQVGLMLPIRAPVPLEHGHVRRLMVAIIHDPQPAYPVRC